MTSTNHPERFEAKWRFAATAALLGAAALGFGGAAFALSLPKEPPSADPVSQAAASAEQGASKLVIWRDPSDPSLVYLDPAADPPQRTVIWISLGSMTIETREVIGAQLVFDDTPEVEMGWEKRRCTVPRDQGLLTFAITRNGTPGKTSFDLAACELIDTSAHHPLKRMGR